MSTDAQHAQRLGSFEQHMKRTTDRAVQTIATASDNAGTTMQRKVTIPVGAIVAIATAINWLLQHWLK